MMRYNYYSRAVIHPDCLRHNLKVIRSLVPAGTKILIPVKCNAYGFGMLAVSQFLEKEKADYLGTAFPFEAIQLRKAGIKKPILVFGEIIHKEDFLNIIKYNLTATVFTHDTLDRLDKAAEKLNRIVPVHIKIDTGMGRNGIPYPMARTLIREAFQKKNVRLEGLYTHLSAADEKEKKFTLEQIERFRDIHDQTVRTGIRIPLVHVLNSAGIMNYPEYGFSMVRPGIMFYGYYPDNRIRKDIPLKQGLSFQSRICYIKKNPDKTPVSYGHTYYTRKNEIIATVCSGYGDGINRLLSNRHSVLYRDRECRIRGRICMDQFMVDISRIKGPHKGDWVTVFGKDIKKEIRLESLAEELDTITYELLCRIGERVERIYLN
ncbi:MAG: alanine racemase [bacterium]|nr:alanine racemase [bacterium]